MGVISFTLVSLEDFHIAYLPCKSELKRREKKKCKNENGDE